MGRYAEARQHLAQAIEQAPPELKANTLNAMATSYAFERRTADAAAFFQQVYDLEQGAERPAGAAAAANALGRLYLETGDVKKARQWYQTGYEMARRQPDEPASQLALWELRWLHAQGRIAARAGRRRRRRGATSTPRGSSSPTTPALKDEGPTVAYLAGYVALYTGDVAAARSELAKADQRDPFNLMLQAEAAEKAGDKAAAQGFWKQILTLNGHGLQHALSRPVAQEMKSVAVSHSTAIATPRRSLALFDVHHPQQHGADDEEGDDREDRVAARAGHAHGRRKQQRADDARELLEDAEEAEELRRLVLRDHRRKQRPRQRLAAALHRGHHERQQEELPDRRHEVAHQADEHVDDQRDEDRRLGADAVGETAEGERKRNPDELHHHERGDQRILRQPDLLAVGTRHADDRADAVVVDQERDQHQEGLPVLAQFAQRPRELAERRHDRAGAGGQRVVPHVGLRAPCGRAESQTRATRWRR